LGIARKACMIDIKTSDVDKFLADLDLGVVVLKQQAATKIDHWARGLFTELVRNSAQWSGNFVSNWNYSVGSPDQSYTRDQNKLENWRGQKPFQRDDPAAVGKALTKMASVAPASWGQSIYFTNATPADDGAYLGDLLVEGRVKLRPVNLVSGQAFMFEQIKVVAENKPV
jgi:hypothetical protein